MLPMEPASWTSARQRAHGKWRRPGVKKRVHLPKRHTAAAGGPQTSRGGAGGPADDEGDEGSLILYAAFGEDDPAVHFGPEMGGPFFGLDEAEDLADLLATAQDVLDAADVMDLALALGDSDVFLPVMALSRMGLLGPTASAALLPGGRSSAGPGSAAAGAGGGQQQQTQPLIPGQSLTAGNKGSAAAGSGGTAGTAAEPLLG